jgi:glycosyltransferase involved in cell wall biosynthesis
MTCYPLYIREKLRTNTDIAIFSSRQVRQDALDGTPDWSDTVILPQGLLDPEFGRLDRREARARLSSLIGASANDFIVLACGTAEMRKGIDLFVGVASHVLAKCRDVRFVWVGGEHRSGPEAMEWARRDAQRAGISHRVHFLGHQKDLEPYFVGADLFLLPSRLDPLPCVVHMAMNCGLPVVAFDNSGGVEEALAYGGGRTVPYLNVAEMAASVLGYIEDRAALLADGDMGRKAVAAHFDFGEYIDRLLSYAMANKAGQPAIMVR